MNGRLALCPLSLPCTHHCQSKVLNQAVVTPGWIETVPGLVPCMPGCCVVLPIGALGVGQVTLLRDSQRKRMSFNPIPKHPSSAVVRNMMLDDTLVPKKIGLMCKRALLFN